MPSGKGTYGSQVGRPSNKRTGPDYLDQAKKKKKRKKKPMFPDHTGLAAKLKARRDATNKAIKKLK